MLVGFGLILLALGLIGAASAPMRGSEVTALVLARLAHDPLLALIVAALFTWVMHSSVAFVLFVISLAGAGLVELPLALGLVLGANVGGGLVALGLASARRWRRGGCSMAISPSGRSARWPCSSRSARSPRRWRGSAATPAGWRRTSTCSSTSGW